MEQGNTGTSGRVLSISQKSVCMHDAFKTWKFIKMQSALGGPRIVFKVSRLSDNDKIIVQFTHRATCTQSK